MSLHWGSRYKSLIVCGIELLQCFVNLPKGKGNNKCSITSSWFFLFKSSNSAGDSRVPLIWQRVKCADKEVIRRNAHNSPVLICDQFTLVFGRINAIWNLFPSLLRPLPLTSFDSIYLSTEIGWQLWWGVLSSDQLKMFLLVSSGKLEYRNYNFVYLAVVG